MGERSPAPHFCIWGGLTLGVGGDTGLCGRGGLARK